MRYLIYVYPNSISVNIQDDKGYNDYLIFEDWEHLLTVMTFSNYVPSIHVRYELI